MGQIINRRKGIGCGFIKRREERGGANYIELRRPGGKGSKL